MKEIYIADIITSQEVTDFFMVKSIAVKIGANKKQYLDLVLGDKTGEITVRSSTEITAGKYIYINGMYLADYIITEG